MTIPFWVFHSVRQCFVFVHVCWPPVLQLNWWPVVRLYALHYGMFWWLCAPIFHFKFDLVFGLFRNSHSKWSKIIELFRIGLKWKWKDTHAMADTHRHRQRKRMWRRKRQQQKTVWITHSSACDHIIMCHNHCYLSFCLCVSGKQLNVTSNASISISLSLVCCYSLHSLSFRVCMQQNRNSTESSLTRLHLKWNDDHIVSGEIAMAFQTISSLRLPK